MQCPLQCAGWPPARRRCCEQLTGVATVRGALLLLMSRIKTRHGESGAPFRTPRHCRTTRVCALQGYLSSGRTGASQRCSGAAAESAATTHHSPPQPRRQRCRREARTRPHPNFCWQRTSRARGTSHVQYRNLSRSNEVGDGGPGGRYEGEGPQQADDKGLRRLWMKNRQLFAFVPSSAALQNVWKGGS